MAKLRVAIGLVLAAVTSLPSCRCDSERRATSSSNPQPPAEDAGAKVPQPEAEEDELVVSTKVERLSGARKIRLEIGNGEAILVLEDASPSRVGGSPVAFGRGSLAAVDRAKGQAFVDGVARWLETPVPAPRTSQAPLTPVKIGFAQLGKATRLQPEAVKLFLQTRKFYAEVYFNLSLDGTQARLMEKDEDYREDLVAFLAMALRDGPLPRRTTKTDPTLASDAALISTSAPIGGDALQHTFMSDGALIGAQGSSIVRWSDPKLAPVPMATFDADVLAIDPAPRGKLVAVQLVRPQTPGVQSSTDPQWLVLWESGTGKKTTLVPEADHPTSGSVWSEDGRQLAIGLRVGERPNRKSVIRVIDVTTRRTVASSDPDLDANAYRWAGRDLVLQQPDDDPEVADRYFTWFPGKSAPKSIEAPPAAVSPDGRFKLAATGDAIALTSKGKDTRYFRGSTEDDRKTIETFAEWPLIFIGPHGVRFSSDEELVLDLDTLKLQRVVDDDSCDVTTTSADGMQVVLLCDGHERYAQVPSSP